MLRLKELFLALANSMFAGAGPLHSERTFGKPLDEGVRTGNLFGVIHHHGDAGMKVAIAGVAYDRRNQAAFLNIAFCLGDAFGKP